MASQARWMLQMLDVLGIAWAAVAAHDVGSAAAQLMVAGAPQRVRGPGGHFTPVDCPDEVATALGEFLACLPPQRWLRGAACAVVPSCVNSNRNSHSRES